MTTMNPWFEMDKDVSDLVENWRWEEPITYNGIYETVYSEDSYDPKHYNYSYSEWRKRRSYYKTPKDIYYKDFIDTLMPLRHGDHPSLHPNEISQNKIYTTISNCIAENIPSTHLLIGTLYSSYHLVSPYMLPTFKYLLTTYKNDINFTVTSISNPRYTVAHIAAMSNNVELMEIFYNLGGNIDVIDGSSFSPLHISLGKRNFKTAHCLLWMNAIVDQQKIIKKLCNFRLRHLMNIISCLQHFLFEIDIYINAVYKSLQSKVYIDINNDIIQSIVTFSLPVQSYQTIKRLLKKLENDEIDGVNISYKEVMDEANQCLSELIDLKKELISIETMENDQDLYPFGMIVEEVKNENFVNKMTLCNLFALSMSDGNMYDTEKWRNKIDSVLCKKKKKSMFQQGINLQNQQQIGALKWILIGAIIIGTAAIFIKQITNRQ